MSLQDFSGKVAWIVGATGALGEATALHLASLGARVVLSGRRIEALEKVARAATNTAIVLPLDVRDDAAVRAAVPTIVAQAGHIDYLVNAPTLPVFGDVLELDDEAWMAVLDTKVLGCVRTARAVLPHLLQRGNGAIVNLSGRGGRQPSAVHLPGGAANAAINLVTKGLADQYGPRGIRINAVAPGPIRSLRLDALSGAGGPRQAATPGEPLDIARAVAFLLSDYARHINGTVLAVDGGSLATV